MEHTSFIETLLQRGADPDLRNTDGETPFLLHFKGIRKTKSIWNGRVELASFLAHGAHPLLRGATGNCPLFEAVRKLPLHNTSALFKASLYKVFCG